jgi:cell volume regulation protein A
VEITIENILLIGSLLLFVSVIAGKTSYKFGVPTLLLFLIIGMLAGADGIGKIEFNDPQIAQLIGIVSLNFILFSGGLDTEWKSVKPVLKEGISLSTLGVLITAISVGVFVHFTTNFSLYESLLLGSIVSSTDAAAVFSILRAKSLSLKKNLRPTLELESGSNDPMAYALTIIFLTLVVNQDQSLLGLIPVFFQQMILGALLGIGFGKLSKIVINKIKLDFEGLYPVLVIALMFSTFSITDFFGGNGFLAIYLCAVYLGNQNLIHKKTILKMYDGLAWLMQIILFLTLGLLVYPSQVLPYFKVGLFISIFLIFIARPIGVFISLSFFKMDLNRRFYISWVGLKGAVPIVFATYPLIAGIDKANAMFNIVFFISIASILAQGTTLDFVAKWFKVASTEKEKPLTDLEKFIADIPKTSIREIEIYADFFAIDKRIVDLNIPKSTFIVMIKRANQFIRPGGSTQIKYGDILYILADQNKDFESLELSLKRPMIG